jgi:hypothetical protein
MSVPLTEMTALPGCGAVPEGVPPDDEPEVPPPFAVPAGVCPLGLVELASGSLDWLSTCWLNGSLLANLLKEVRTLSWVSGALDDAREPVEGAAGDAVAEPLRVGAASDGVPVGVAPVVAV